MFQKLTVVLMAVIYSNPHLPPVLRKKELKTASDDEKGKDLHSQGSTMVCKETRKGHVYTLLFFRRTFKENIYHNRLSHLRVCRGRYCFQNFLPSLPSSADDFVLILFGDAERMEQQFAITFFWFS